MQQVGSYVGNTGRGARQPLAAGTLDRVITAAIEGPADQMWFQAVVYLRAEAAVASGSQHRIMSAISQRIARSESVSTEQFRHVADRCGLGLDLPASSLAATDRQSTRGEFRRLRRHGLAADHQDAPAGQGGAGR